MKRLNTFVKFLFFVSLLPFFCSCDPSAISGDMHKYFPFTMLPSPPTPKPEPKVGEQQSEEEVDSVEVVEDYKPAEPLRAITYEDYVGVRDNFSGYVNEGLNAPQGTCTDYVDDVSVSESSGIGYSSTYDWIAESMRGGSYKFPKPKTGSDHDSICHSINTIVESDNLGEHAGDLIPQASDCTYASYIGTLIMLKNNNPDIFEQNRSNFHCGGEEPPCAKTRCTRYSGNLVLFAREPLTWMKRTLGRGNYKTIPRRNIMKSYESGMPKKGDLVNIFRNPSGHSVIFDRIENGKFCYWSSNRSTRGMGTWCESLSRFQNITVGSL
jgi:hypothetical protein